MYSGFKIHVWNTVYHNDEFSHNITKEWTIVAENEQEARRVAEEMLQKGETTEVLSWGLTIRTSGEWIYRIDNIGRAHKITYWEFDNSRERLEYKKGK